MPAEIYPNVGPDAYFWSLANGTYDCERLRGCDKIMLAITANAFLLAFLCSLLDTRSGLRIASDASHRQAGADVPLKVAWKFHCTPVHQHGKVFVQLVCSWHKTRSCLKFLPYVFLQEVDSLKAALQDAEQRISGLRTSYKQEKATAEVSRMRRTPAQLVCVGMYARTDFTCPTARCNERVSRKLGTAFVQTSIAENVIVLSLYVATFACSYCRRRRRSWRH